MNPPDAFVLLGDDAITAGSQDRLDRHRFARRAAELLENVSRISPSTVAGLIGPWGSGKSSVLAMMQEELEASGNWKVVTFNPWELSDLESLVLEFLSTLASALPSTGKVRKAMGRYAKKIAPLTSVISVVGVDPSTALDAVGERLLGDGSLAGQRRKLEKALAEHGQRLVVLVDDVDRLQADELTMILKLVRLVGRLPNVSYVLAYDEATLLDVLAATELAAGNQRRALAYLDKIIQLRLDLPPVTVYRVRTLVQEALDVVTERSGVVPSDDDWERFRSVYVPSLEASLLEPRNVKRYFGQVEAVYPLVRDEVNFIDFLLVTFLRVFFPSVHRELPAHKAELTGMEFLPTSGRPTADERVVEWKRRLREDHSLSEREAERVLSVLGLLYPPLRPAGGGRADASNRSAGSDEYFDRYLYLAVPPDDVSDSDVHAAVEQALAGRLDDECERLIDRLNVAAEAIADKLARVLPSEPSQSRSLAQFAARILHHTPQGGFLDRAHAVVRTWLRHLIVNADRNSPEEFFECLRQELPVSDIAMVLHDIQGDAFGGRDKMPPELEPLRELVTSALVAELGVQAMNPLDLSDGVMNRLFWWSQLSGDADVQSWLRTQISSGAWLIDDVVALFIPLATFESGKQRLSDFSLDQFERFVGFDYALALFTPCESADPIDWWSGSDVTFAERKRRAHDVLAREASRRSQAG